MKPVTPGWYWFRFGLVPVVVEVCEVGIAGLTAYGRLGRMGHSGVRDDTVDLPAGIRLRQPFRFGDDGERVGFFLSRIPKPVRDPVTGPQPGDVLSVESETAGRRVLLQFAVTERFPRRLEFLTGNWMGTHGGMLGGSPQRAPLAWLGAGPQRSNHRARRGRTPRMESSPSLMGAGTALMSELRRGDLFPGSDGVFVGRTPYGTNTVCYSTDWHRYKAMCAAFDRNHPALALPKPGRKPNPWPPRSVAIRRLLFDYGDYADPWIRVADGVVVARIHARETPGPGWWKQGKPSAYSRHAFMPPIGTAIHGVSRTTTDSGVLETACVEWEIGSGRPRRKCYRTLSRWVSSTNTGEDIEDAIEPRE